MITFGDLNKKGPANVKLDLLLNDQKVSETTSSNDGSYYFSNIMPGDYKIKASHSNWKFKVDTINVILSKDNWSAKDYIIVSGYTIEGYVVTVDRKPIKNAIVSLKFATDNIVDTSDYECFKSFDSNEICHVMTNEKGKFEFKNIVNQKYVLKAVYKAYNDSILINSKPDSINVELIKHDNLILNDKFELNYLNLNSKALIVDSKNNNNELPFENAKVIINDKETGLKTNNNGEFQLNSLMNGVNYKITLKSEHVEFEEKSVKIDLNLKTFQENFIELKNLLKFYIKSFDVCGKIKFKQEIKSDDLASLSKIIRLKVFQYGSKNEEINTRLVNIDEKLSYCFKLNKSPLEYIIKIDVSGANANDFESFLKFNVDEQRVFINRDPVLDLNFEQFDAELNGVVQFLDECPNDFKLSLKSKNKVNLVKEITELKCNQEMKQVEFHIKNVLFGQYYLVSNYDHVFCWNLDIDSNKDKNSLLLEVKNEKETIHLKQIAFKLEYKFHDLNVNFKLFNENNEIIIQKIISNQAGQSGLICIEKLDNFHSPQTIQEKVLSLIQVKISFLFTFYKIIINNLIRNGQICLKMILN